MLTNTIIVRAENAERNVNQENINETVTGNESSDTSNEMADFTVPEFEPGMKGELSLKNSMSEKVYDEFSSINNLQIEAGENFTLLLKENGTVWAWGNNKYGQLGNGTTEQSGIPQKISELENIVHIYAGATFAFAINHRGEVFAWGDNRYAQLGDGTTTQRTKPVRITSLTNIKKISAGYYHTVALKNDGTVYFWGNPKMNTNVYGYEFERRPIEIDIKNIKDISSGKTHIVILSEDGEIYTWGENSKGQLGNGTFGDTVDSPQKIKLSANITKIESGSEHCVALDDSGHIYAWGSNLYGQLGDGTNENKYIPIVISTIDDIKDVIAGYRHTILIKNNNDIYTCGNNEYGQLGNGTTDNSTVPIKVSSQYKPVSISGGLSHTVEVDAEGNIYGWGINSSGQLGKSDNIPINTILNPTDVYGLENIISIANGIYHSLALDHDGTVWSWGYNSHNQLGDGTTINRDTPKRIIDNVKSISAGYYHSVALKKDGTVWAWGFNGFSQIGQNDNKNYSPVQVQGLTDVIAIAAGAYHTLALKNDGTVWMWGKKNCPNEKTGKYDTIKTPIQIEGLSNIKSISAGFDYDFAVQESGTVYAWGNNRYGQLGDGTNNNSETPIQLDVQNIKYISAGSYHTIMINEDGELFGFGYNLGYQYGDINENKITNIESVASGDNYSLMLTRNGRVLACGYNNYGQLGNGTNTKSIIPAEIKGLIDIKDIAVGSGGHSVALKNDGTVVAWGNNGSGQLGTGEKFAFKNPCLFGSFENAKSLDAGGSFLGTIKHIFGQNWYRFNVPYDAQYKISVSQGCELEIYKNGAIYDMQANNVFELKSEDKVYIRVIRKNELGESYTLNIVSDKIVNTIYKKDLIILGDSEYYINLYDNRYLYKDDIKLTDYPVNSICNNGNTLFIAGKFGIDRVDGIAVTRVVDASSNFIVADEKTIYFSNMNDGNKIYYSKIGSNRYSKLTDDAGIFLKLDDTYLYYYNIKNHCQWTKVKKVQ